MSSTMSSERPKRASISSYGDCSDPASALIGRGGEVFALRKGGLNRISDLRFQISD